MPIKSYMSWVGGKSELCKLLYEYFPIGYSKYVEVFGGAGWLLFHKPPGREIEVYNDYNSLLVNLYHCVREAPQDLIDALEFTLNARVDFNRIRAASNGTPPYSPDAHRAAQFYQLIRFSYASGLKSFGAQPHDMWSNFPLIRAAHRRLAKVVIENKDFEALIKQHGGPGTFLYVDPPYYKTENMYQNVGKEGFCTSDHTRLRDALLGNEGYFLLSYNCHEEIFKLYDKPGICIKRISRLHNMRQRYEGGAMFDELIIANYDLEKARESKVLQTNMFDTGNHIIY